jgi:hypothetical protein
MAFDENHQPPMENRKPRGKAKRTLILDAIKKKALIGMHEGATRAECEEAFFGHIASRAFNPEDKDSGTLLKFLGDKGWAGLKPTMEPVEFELDETATPAFQAAQVMKASSLGKIPPDVAGLYMTCIASMMKIEEVTTIKADIERIKEQLGIGDV